MDIRKIIGERIKELRKQQGLSQENLAYICEIDRTYMTSVENGKRNISVQILLKIVTGLKISFREFFNHGSFNDGDHNSSLD